MSWATLGSLALPFHLQRAGVQARTDLARHSQELTTGQVESPARHLRGDIALLHTIENRLQRIGGFKAALDQTSIRFDTAQSALDRVAAAGQSLSEKLVLTAQSVGGVAARSATAQAAKTALEETFAALNTSTAGQSLFAGVQTDRTPLASAQTLLDALGGAVEGSTTAAQATAALETFFFAEGGGFDTTIYRGGTAGAGGMMDDGEPAPALPTADDPAFRRQMMAMAMVVLIDNGALTLDPAEERAMQTGALSGLMGNAPNIVGLQAGIGLTQEVIEHRQTRLAHESDRLAVLRSDKIGVDPYRAAMAVEQARVQLESIYTVTARISRLSLTEFLR